MQSDSVSPRGNDSWRNGEDAYEAALRAADALFAPAPNRVVERAPVETTAQPALVDASGEQQPQVGQAEAVESTAREGGGRILRAIDEPEPSGFADLEAEHAPKRRGRKPGSKNKPKTPVLDVAAAPAAMVPPIVPDASAASPTASHLDGEEDDEIVQVPIHDHPEPVASANPVVADYLARGDKRFGWVRTKLAPGEQWKRRLPKVCW